MKKFNSKSKANVGITLSADRLVSIQNYVPNPTENRFYVLGTENVNIFKPFDPKKPNTAPRALYAVGRIPYNADTEEFVDTYGDRVIIVSKQFSKLSKKTQSLLIEKACFELAGVPDRFIGGLENIDGTNLDRKVAAELQMMEKHGYGKVKKILKKENSLNIVAEKKAGRALHRMFKKGGGVSAKNKKSDTGEDLKRPLTFRNTEVSPQIVEN